MALQESGMQVHFYRPLKVSVISNFNTRGSSEPFQQEHMPRPSLDQMHFVRRHQKALSPLNKSYPTKTMCKINRDSTRDGLIRSHFYK